jgi:hypothetical protein
MTSDTIKLKFTQNFNSDKIELKLNFQLLSYFDFISDNFLMKVNENQI